MTVGRKFALWVLAVACLFPTHSQAAFITSSIPLGFGSTVAVPETIDSPGILLAALVYPFTYSKLSGTTSAVAVSAVFLRAGTLDFYYQIENTPPSASVLSREFANTFSGLQTQVAYRTDGATLPGGLFVGGGQAPVSADRDISGATVGFNFLPGIGPGTKSAILVVSTDATAFGPGFAFVVDDVVAVASFQAVPEPSSFVFAVVGLAALAGVNGHQKA